jgi:hypothetical protein
MTLLEALVLLLNVLVLGVSVVLLAKVLIQHRPHWFAIEIGI